MSINNAPPKAIDYLANASLIRHRIDMIYVYMSSYIKYHRSEKRTYYYYFPVLI